MHQKSSGNIDTLSKHLQKSQHHSSSSLGKVTVRNSIKHKQSSAIYNSNNQKIVEP